MSTFPGEDHRSPAVCSGLAFRYVRIMMNNKFINRCIDIAGKLLLAWFVFSTIRYFYYGSFIEELNMIPIMFRNGDMLLLIYVLFTMPVAAVGVFILIPLLFRGHIGGLIFGILYWAMCYPTNPLWFVVPHEMQVNANGSATAILWGINISFSIISLIIIVLFYFYRRSIKLKNT
jgi:hypothetical protein